jgi:asparagine synthase (glutamine-hydrolysing)
MCGIAGFIDFSSLNRENAREKLLRMTDCIVHRGPDAGGAYVDTYAALGHRRLSIIDLATGHQPMADVSGRYRIVFNGEIYNFPALKRELEILGYRFATASDTEVILQAYACWGSACVERFNGMFAFALWDTLEKRVFIARDRVGKKPLYYTWDGRCFAFASELKALIQGGFTGRTIDSAALDAYFCLGYIPSPMAVFTDVHKLPPATAGVVTPEGPSFNRYWDLDCTPEIALTLDEACDRLDALLRDAVCCRMMSEVPLGAFLSSGLDSGLVVSYMAELSDRPVATHTMGFEEDAFNESAGARLIAGHLGTRHSEFVSKPEDMETLLSIARCLDEPFADNSVLPSWHVCRNAARSVTVALTGDGGDEGFGGYTFRYLPHVMESRIRRWIPKGLRQGVFGPAGKIYPASARLPKVLRVKTILENIAQSDARAFYNDLVWLREDDRNRLYTKAFKSALSGRTPGERVVSLYEQCQGADALSRAQYTDIRFYLPEDVLVKADRMSMAHGLELRNPFLDHRILEFGVSLPSDLKISRTRGKLLLRHLARKKLPPEVVNLPKKGFSVPAAHWLRTGLKGFARDVVFQSPLIKELLNRDVLDRMWTDHQSCARDHHVFLWSTMMLGLWEKNFAKP